MNSTCLGDAHIKSHRDVVKGSLEKLAPWAPKFYKTRAPQILLDVVLRITNNAIMLV